MRSNTANWFAFSGLKGWLCLSRDVTPGLRHVQKGARRDTGNRFMVHRVRKWATIEPSAIARTVESAPFE